MRVISSCLTRYAWRRPSLPPPNKKHKNTKNTQILNLLYELFSMRIFLKKCFFCVFVLWDKHNAVRPLASRNNCCRNRQRLGAAPLIFIERSSLDSWLRSFGRFSKKPYLEARLELFYLWISFFGLSIKSYSGLRQLVYKKYTLKGPDSRLRPFELLGCEKRKHQE